MKLSAILSLFALAVIAHAAAVPSFGKRDIARRAPEGPEDYEEEYSPDDPKRKRAPEGPEDYEEEYSPDDPERKRAPEGPEDYEEEYSPDDEE